MNVVLLTARYTPSIGGIERQCGLLAKEFARQGHGVVIVTDRYAPSLPRAEQDGTVHIVRLPSLSFLHRSLERYVSAFKTKNAAAREGAILGRVTSEKRWTVTAVKNIYRMLLFKLPILSFAASTFVYLLWNRKRYDVIQVFQTQMLAYVAAAAGVLLGKPVVAREATLHGIDILDDFPMQRHTTRFVLRHCHFIAMSRAILDDLRARGVPASGISVIHNSVLADDCPPGPVDRWSVVFVGNVFNDPLQKGLDILLQAWVTVNMQCPEAHLAIVGDADRSIFPSMAAELGILGSVQFTGAQTGLDAIYGGRNIFVLPSRYEGMSNALLEAMAAGKACVVTRVSGSDDLIDDHRTGLKVAAGDAAGLAHALIYLLDRESEARNFGSAAREHVRMHHTPEMIAQQYSELYARLISAARQ